MASADELAALKEKVADLKQKSDRAAGALEQSMVMLKKDHGCASLEEAKKKLKKMERETNEAGEAFEEALEKFKAEYKDRLE